ncbi:MAG: hypothetical protein LBF97_02135 [Elusimicrobiota bacterium]|nr:hypothetical protein [Elusimicrobiota bacterium]
MSEDFSISIDMKDLDQTFKKVLRELKHIKGVKVGYFRDYKYPNGRSLIANALTHEFGADVKIPDYAGRLYKHISKLNSKIFNRKGRSLKKGIKNWLKVDIKKTFKIPARPFMDITLNKYADEWVKDFQKNLSNERDIGMQLLELGDSIKSDIAHTINSNLPPPNAKSTIRKKKSTQTLIDTKKMVTSIHREIVLSGE